MGTPGVPGAVAERPHGEGYGLAAALEMADNRDMRLPIVHSPDYHADIPGEHRFPMGKFRRLAEVLVEQGIAEVSSFAEPEPLDADPVCRVHDRAYVECVFSARVDPWVSREIGLPISQSVALRARSACAGTILAGRLALQHGISCNTAGGSHHARREQGAGFCVFNDVAIALASLRSEGLIERALIIDLDVHQGDGTAEIFEGDDQTFTYSVHGEKNYPVRKRVSDRDVALPDGTDDEAYLAALKETLAVVLEASAPDIVFFNAGVDPHFEDRLGRLSLSDAGLASRDRYVFDLVRRADIPVAAVLGGGYSTDIDALARRHASMFAVASEFI